MSKASMVEKAESPNEELAEQIVDSLVSKRLIEEHRVPTLMAKLKNGPCSASDWRVWAEDFAKPGVDDDEATP